MTARMSSVVQSLYGCPKVTSVDSGNEGWRVEELAYPTPTGILHLNLDGINIHASNLDDVRRRCPDLRHIGFSSNVFTMPFRFTCFDDAKDNPRS